MKRIVIGLSLASLVFFSFCGFVDPHYTNVYNGRLLGSSYDGYQITFYLDSYVLAVDSSGSILNASDSVIHGSGMINNLEVPLRLFPSSTPEAEIDGSWVPVGIVPDRLPSSFPWLVYLAPLALIFVLFLLINSILRGFGI